jgi:hypothetical protein
MKPMLCPFCLGYATFEKKEQKRRKGFTRQYYSCVHCSAEVPRMYFEDYRRNPPAVVSAVGFTQHGKSVYFASLFYAFRCMNLARDWPGFQTLCLNEDSLQTVNRNLEQLRGGKLPPATAKNFPTPTLLHVDFFPNQPNCTLLFYDTAGESFTQPRQLGQYARFVRRARTVLFFVSLSKTGQDGPISAELERLLETYIVGVRDLGTKRKEQNLVVVYTMADMLADVMGSDWSFYRERLVSPQLGDEAHGSYLRELVHLSYRLRRFTESRLGAHGFLNMAHGFFRKVSFCMVSSLGSAPQEDNTLAVELTPRRVLDPLMYVMRHGVQRRGLGLIKRLVG